MFSYVLVFTGSEGNSCSLLSFGVIQTALTITSVSTPGFNSTVQIRVREDSAKIVPAGFVIVTDVGGGTV